jgi:hypothetical protein
MPNDIQTLIHILARLDFSRHHLQAQRYLLTIIGLDHYAARLTNLIYQIDTLRVEIEQTQLPQTEEAA